MTVEGRREAYCERQATNAVKGDTRRMSAGALKLTWLCETPAWTRSVTQREGLYAPWSLSLVHLDLGSWILDLETGPNPTDYPRTSANVGA